MGTAIAAAVVVTGCDAGGFFCGSDAMCGWSETDLSRVAALANLPSTPPVDGSNAYATNPDAIALGKMFYFDTRFSGPSTWVDGLGHVMPFGRTAIGQSAGVSCASCHDHGHGAVDPSHSPGDVSVGAGWTYNNSLTTFNSAYYELHLWNGRADSLWAQAVADNENPLTTNGNRLHTAWLINDLYGAASTVSPNYPAVFADPLPPFGGPATSVQAVVDASGQCPAPV
ncbi:MAG TPA: cytochrome-c peroxidase, partial [Polyangia bacterium]|nr:cytochrome-c peroxidase [Polyangia bacterium]